MRCPCAWGGQYGPGIFISLKSLICTRRRTGAVMYGGIIFSQTVFIMLYHYTHEYYIHHPFTRSLQEAGGVMQLSPRDLQFTANIIHLFAGELRSSSKASTASVAQILDQNLEIVCDIIERLKCKNIKQWVILFREIIMESNFHSCLITRSNNQM